MSKPPSAKARVRLLPLPVALFFMLLGLLLGVFRLMINNGISLRILPFERMYTLHAQIVIFGFLGTLIMLERMIGLEVLPWGQRLRAARLMIPFFIVGLLLYLLGSLSGATGVLLLGGVMLSIGSILFAHVIWLLMSHGGDRLSFGFMLLGCLALTSSSLLSTYLLPVDRSSFALLLLSFPVLFILGERVELTRFSAGASERLRFKAALVIASLSLALLILHTIRVSAAAFAILSSIGYLVVIVTIYLSENSSFKRSSASRSPLQKYVRLHVKLAYLWILIGVMFLILLQSGVSNPYLYDASIHSVGVGFVGTMILAHGPIIMPVLLRRNLRAEALSLAPLSLLTLANAIRVLGDLAKPLYPNTAHAVGYSGPLVLVSVLAFFLVMRRATQAAP